MNGPPRSGNTMTPEDTPADQHDGTMEQEKCSSGRTSSPSAMQTMQDCAMSLVETSPSSTRSPTPSEHQFNQYAQSGMAHQTPGSLSEPMLNDQISQMAASWETGSPDFATSSTVPAVISTPEATSSNYPSGFPGKNQKAGPSKAAKVKPVAGKKKHTAKNARTNGTSEKPNGDSVNSRRQKRLERNRESARLSRRRRKQYLEVLEERVTKLSVEVDEGRRLHAARAIDTVSRKRSAILNQPLDDGRLLKLDGPLNRTSEELSVLATFNTQQLKSFALPPHSKFILWLTLQGDTYFRGGRAASERLSAARIGERMLQNGRDNVSPSEPMWPLFCNEIGLSYDQEERVRNFQRSLLQESITWLDRHTARSSTLAMQSFHDSMNSVSFQLLQRERGMMKGLSAEQKHKFSAWADRNADRIRAKLEKKRSELKKVKQEDAYELKSAQHVAANLYILNHRLQKITSEFPNKLTILTQAATKRLSRRPSFESLGNGKEEGTRALSRDNSFASAGSLKRIASSMSMDDSDRPQPQQVSPEDGQEAARATVDKELGFVKDIIPPQTTPVPPPAPTKPAVSLPPSAVAQPPFHYISQTPPTPLTTAHPRSHLTHSASNHPTQIAAQHPTPIAAQHPTPIAAHHPTPIAAHPHPGASIPQHQSVPQPLHPRMAQYIPSTYSHQQHYQHSQSTPQVYAQNIPPQHVEQTLPSRQQQPSPSPASHLASQPAQSSFLPPHLNSVPEEMFPSGDGAEEFFIGLMEDEDWAIGEGVVMDTST